MLIPSSPPSLQTSFNNPRQIALRGTVSGAVIYTVPAGKKFQGIVYSDALAQSVTITPAGGSAGSMVVPPIGLTSNASAPMSITLVAGSIVTSSSGNSIYLHGVESDL